MWAETTPIVHQRERDGCVSPFHCKGHMPRLAVPRHVSHPLLNHAQQRILHFGREIIRARNMQVNQNTGLLALCCHNLAQGCGEALRLQGEWAHLMNQGGEFLLGLMRQGIGVAHMLRASGGITLPEGKRSAKM